MKKEIIDAHKQREREVTNASFVTESGLNAFRTIQAFSNEILDANTLITQLCTQTKEIMGGDARKLEMILMSQAQTFDVIFHFMMRASMKAKLIPQLQTYAELGFKAQNQCRKTLLALSEIKNPKRATFIKQQNNAVSQQVNNGINSENLKKTKNTTNELLSEAEYETLDSRREEATVTINPTVETVENGRGKNASRKRNKQDERL